DAVFDGRFTRINDENRNEVELDCAYRDHALDDVRDDRTIPARVLGHNMANFFEFRPDKNESAERSDGRNITFRSVTLPLFYVVTVAGLVGLWRFRRRRGAELLLIQAGYFVVASLVTIAVPRLRVPLDLAAAIGAGLLVAELIARRAGEQVARADERPRPSPPAPPSTWRARVLVALAGVAPLVGSPARRPCAPTPRGGTTP